MEGRHEGAPPGGKWSRPEVAARYADARWRSPRRRGRDPRLVGGILRRHLGAARGPVLDAPCGAGRLRAALAPFATLYVGLDASGAMLGHVPEGPGALVRGDVARLPFRERTFAAVVACRLLHHQRDADVFLALVRELVRVARELVVCSFWDAGSLPALRRRLLPGGRGGGRARGRTAHSKRFVRDAFRSAGAELVAFHHSLRFLGRQTFAVARPLRADR